MFRNLKTGFYYSAFFLLTAPLVASAHVKWFIDEHSSKEILHENWGYYSLVWISVAIFFVGFGIFLERHLPHISKHTQYKINSLKHKIASLFGMALGVFFLIASYKGFLFSHNLDDLWILESPLIAIQALIGLGFLVGFGVRVLSVLLIFLWIFSFFYVGPIDMLEALWVLGGAAVSLIYGRSHFKISREGDFSNKFFLVHEEYAIPLLRVFVGLDLIILGFSEKILNPNLGLLFLEKFHWNFMQNLGVDWFSDYLFVFSAGGVEILFGLILVLGVITRINTLVLGIVFTIPVFLMGPSELIGHMPHFIAVFMLLIFGSGTKLKFVKSTRPQHGS